MGYSTKLSGASAKDMRQMMMRKKLPHKKIIINEVHDGSCGPQQQRCLNDVIALMYQQSAPYRREIVISITDLLRAKRTVMDVTKISKNKGRSLLFQAGRWNRRDN
jgi:hypothetical protein